jgi:hypothetical protein
MKRFPTPALGKLGGCLGQQNWGEGQQRTDGIKEIKKNNIKQK